MNKIFAQPWHERKKNIHGRFVKNGSLNIFKRLPETNKFLERFLDFGNKRGGAFSEQTVERYKLDLAEFFTFVNKDFKQVTEEDCESFFNYLKKRGLNIKSITWRIMTVKSFFRFAVEKREVLFNPMQIRIPAKDLKPDDEWVMKQCLKRSEVKAILEAVPDPRDHAILTVLYNHGCRIGELVDLKLSNLDFDRNTIIFNGKTGKRVNEMNLDTINSLKMWLLVRNSTNEFLFVSRRGNQITSQYVRQVLHHTCLKAGIMKKISQCKKCQDEGDNPECKSCDWDRIITPHSLRHSMICHSLNDGVNPVELSKFVGHSLHMLLYYSSLSALKTYHNFKGVHGED